MSYVGEFPLTNYPQNYNVDRTGYSELPVAQLLMNHSDLCMWLVYPESCNVVALWLQNTKCASLLGKIMKEDAVLHTCVDWRD